MLTCRTRITRHHRHPKGKRKARLYLQSLGAHSLFEVTAFFLAGLRSKRKGKDDEWKGKGKARQGGAVHWGHLLEHR